MDESRMALRRVMKRPASTLASLATLACALAAATVTWGILSALFLTPLPVRDPDTLVVVGATPVEGRRAGIQSTTFSYTAVQPVLDSGAFAAATAIWAPTRELLVDAAGTTEPASVAFAAHDFLDVLGVPLARGRAFETSDDQRGATPVAVLTDQYWQRAFRRDPSVVGRTLTIENAPVTIVGVLARGFRGVDLSQTPDLYLPVNTIAGIGRSTTNYFAERGTGYSPTAGWTIIGRLHPGASDTSRRVDAAMPPQPGPREHAVLVPIEVAAIPPQARVSMVQFSRLLGGTVLLQLVVGCLSVGMLLLVRTEARRDELATCVALGASRVRLAYGIALESALTTIGGLLLAVPGTVVLFGLVRGIRLPGGVALQSLDLTLDGRATLALGLSSLAAGVIAAGFAMAFVFRASIRAGVRRGGSTQPYGRQPLRTALVAVQVAVSLAALTGAALFSHSLSAALDLNSGIGADRTITSRIDLARHAYTPQQARTFYEQLQAGLANHPAIERIATYRNLGGMPGSVHVDGVPHRVPSTVWDVAVGERYFDAMGMRLIDGRTFLPHELTGDAPVAVISASLGRVLERNGTALGRRLPIETGRTDIAADGRIVVGVVADVVERIQEPSPLIMFVPAPPAVGLNRSIVIRARGPADVATREFIAAVRGLDPRVFPALPATLDDRIRRQMAPQQLALTVLATLSVLATLLTLIGNFVIAEASSLARRREMGIRAALGATRRQLGAIVLAQTVRTVGLGLVAGLGLAWLGAGTIQSFLFEVQPLDPPTLGAVALSILLLSLAVSLRAALRAARVDLSTVLKAE